MFLLRTRGYLPMDCTRQRHIRQTGG